MLRKNSAIAARIVPVVLLVVILDQISKFIVLKHFGFLVSFNSGGAFGFGQNLDGYLYITLVLVIVSALIIFYAIKNQSNMVLPFTLIFSGATSNLIDRLVRHHVVDFINPKIWPSFNIADLAIVAGAIWAFWAELRRR